MVEVSNSLDIDFEIYFHNIPAAEDFQRLIEALDVSSRLGVTGVFRSLSDQNLLLPFGTIDRVLNVYLRREESTIIIESVEIGSFKVKGRIVAVLLFLSDAIGSAIIGDMVLRTDAYKKLSGAASEHQYQICNQINAHFRHCTSSSHPFSVTSEVIDGRIVTTVQIQPSLSTTPEESKDDRPNVVPEHKRPDPDLFKHLQKRALRPKGNEDEER